MVLGRLGLTTGPECSRVQVNPRDRGGWARYPTPIEGYVS
jgi:hypothetical protein